MQSVEGEMLGRGGQGGVDPSTTRPSTSSPTDSSARLRKLLDAASKANQQRPRELADEEGRTSNEEFYRGCARDGRSQKVTDKFVVTYAYDLYTTRPWGAGPSAVAATAEEEIKVQQSIHTLDELVEFYVIEYLDIGDCAIEGLYMIDRTPTDHVQPDAVNPCPNTTSSICTPVAGGLTVEYDADVISKSELERSILDAIEYGMDNDKLLPQQSAIRGVVFMGPEHETVGDGDTLSLSSSSSSPSLSGQSPASTSSDGGASTAGVVVGIIGGIVLFAGLIFSVLRVRNRSLREKPVKQWTTSDDDSASTPTGTTNVHIIIEEQEEEKFDDKHEFV